jgi:hypothetical protein
MTQFTNEQVAALTMFGVGAVLVWMFAGAVLIRFLGWLGALGWIGGTVFSVGWLLGKASFGI